MASSSSFNATLAVLLAAKYCRQYPLFRWREEAFPSIGRRAEKYYFRVDMLNLHQEKSGEMLFMLLPSQLSLLDFQKGTTLYRLKALLVTLKHPYILPILDMYYSKDKQALLFVQPFVPTGSLKDYIYRVNDPSQPFNVKYHPENARPLPFDEIAKFSRQILEALNGLRSKGIMYDHLKSTNVVIDEGNARLTDLYLPLLAIDRYNESRILTVSLEEQMDIDLLLFGHLLYEMATGMELSSTQPSQSVLKELGPEITDVLNAIFYNYDNSLLVVDDVNASESNCMEEDDSHSVSTRTCRKNKKHLFVLDVDKILKKYALFTSAENVPPIQTLFAGFRLDSSMKKTIQHSMRINASRTQAHLVHYKDQQTLLLARQRAERRVYEEKEKHQLRLQQLSHRKQLSSDNKDCNSKTIPPRRKSYRVDKSRTQAQRPYPTS
ncbi:putative protein kinase [Plasmopara halstedii]